MTPEVVKWPRVDRDLIEHFARIAQDKLEPAERLLIVAEESFERLAAMPSIGTGRKTKRSHLKGIRLYPMPAPYKSYIIFYRETTGGIEVIAVLHGARDMENVLRKIME